MRSDDLCSVLWEARGPRVRTCRQRPTRFALPSAHASGPWMRAPTALARPKPLPNGQPCVLAHSASVQIGGLTRHGCLSIVAMPRPSTTPLMGRSESRASSSPLNKVGAFRGPSIWPSPWPSLQSGASAPASRSAGLGRRRERRIGAEDAAPMMRSAVIWAMAASCRESLEASGPRTLARFRRAIRPQWRAIGCVHLTGQSFGSKMQQTSTGLRPLAGHPFGFRAINQKAAPNTL